MGNCCQCWCMMWNPSLAGMLRRPKAAWHRRANHRWSKAADTACRRRAGVCRARWFARRRRSLRSNAPQFREQERPNDIDHPQRVRGRFVLCGGGHLAGLPPHIDRCTDEVVPPVRAGKLGSWRLQAGTLPTMAGHWQ